MATWDAVGSERRGSFKSPDGRHSFSLGSNLDFGVGEVAYQSADVAYQI